MVSDDLWERAQDAFERLRGVPPERRAVEIQAICGADEALRAEVASLLNHDTEAGNVFLESPGSRLRRHLASGEDWAQALIGRRLGHFTLVRVVASGGMGCVFEARQDQPARAVAIKLMKPGFSATSAISRFRVEPEFLGRLQHPNIAQVYEAGVHDDAAGPLPYFAMELVPEAQSLTEFAANRRLDLNARLALFAKVCDAVHHGHQKGIIHRDIKPANILVAADGEPKVIDFGVARATDADVMMTTQCTHAGDLVGTLRYMSPEQCDGVAAAVDTRADIYSLGVVLYELLTGVAPYEAMGTTVYAAMRVIKEAIPRQPSRVNRVLRGDLDAILLKALEKEPARRYASAAAFGDDLRRTLAHEPILARPPSPLYITRRFVRRNGWQTVTAAFVVVSLLATAAILEARREGRIERELLERAAYRGLLQSAEGALLINDAAGALYQLEAAAADKRSSWEWRHLRSRVDQSIYCNPVDADRGGTSESSISRDRRLLAQQVLPGPRVDLFDLENGELKRTTSAAELVALFNRGIPKADQQAPGGVDVCVSPDSTWVVMMPGTERWSVISVRDAERGTELRAWRVIGSGSLLDFHPSLPILATRCVDGTFRSLRFWKLDSNALALNRPIDDAPPCVVVDTNDDIATGVFSPNGEFFAGCDSDACVRLWKTDELLHGGTIDDALQLYGHTYHLTGAAFSADSTLLATCSADRTARVWNVERCFELALKADSNRLSAATADAVKLAGANAGLFCVAFDASNDIVAAGDDSGVVWIWQRQSANMPSASSGDWVLVNSLRGHADQIRSIDLVQHGLFLTASRDGTLRWWGSFVEDIPRLRGHRTSVYAVAVTQDGRYAVSGDGGQSMFVWDLASGAPVQRVACPPGVSFHGICCWDIGGRQFIGAAYRALGQSAHCGLVIWQLDDENGAPHVALEYTPSKAGEDEKCSLFSIAVARNGRRLAVGDADGGVHVLDLSEDGRMVRRAKRYDLQTDAVIGLAFLDADGRWLLATSGGEEWTNRAAIRVLDADSGATVGAQPQVRPDVAVSAVAVRFGTPGGKESPVRATTAVTATGDGELSFWSISWTGGEPSLVLYRKVSGHNGSVTAVAFHPKEPRLASTGVDRTVRIWDSESHTELVALRGAKGSLNDAAFDPSGQILLTACNGIMGVDNAVLVWTTDGRPPNTEPRLLRAETWQWYVSLRNAIEPEWNLANPGRLIDQYDGDLELIANAEGWPERVRAYAKAHFTEFIQNVTEFSEPAWAIVCDPDKDTDEYERALAHAIRATEMDPWNVKAHAAAGGAMYRLARIEEAIKYLERSCDLAKIARRLNSESPPSFGLAFLAMSYCENRQDEAGQAAFDKLRSELARPNQTLNSMERALVREAEGVLRRSVAERGTGS